MIEAKCEYCGKEFDATPKSRKKKTPNRFCSRTCKNHAMSKTVAPDAAFFKRSCEECKKVFDATPSRPRYEPPKRFCPDCFFRGRGKLIRSSSERACEQCGKKFYVPECRVRAGRSKGKYCSRPCAHQAWREGKGVPVYYGKRDGRLINVSGYVEVFRPNNPTAVRLREEGKHTHRSNGWILEHRLVMEQFIGRPLHPWENVHHKNGVRTDNRPENLELWIKTQPTGTRFEDIAGIYGKELLEARARILALEEELSAIKSQLQI